MVQFLFSVHTITDAKQINRQGGARAVDLPVRSFDLARPGVEPPLFIARDFIFLPCAGPSWLLISF